MEKFEITILGCGSATPGLKHFTSSQVLNIREKLFMIDCGEGDEKIEVVYNRKSRLKQKISKCTAPNKALFLQYYN
jgi:ribonuclease Z